jgi:hypothetical protein
MLALAVAAACMHGPAACRAAAVAAAVHLLRAWRLEQACPLPACDPLPGGPLGSPQPRRQACARWPPAAPRPACAGARWSGTASAGPSRKQCSS